MRPIIVTTPRTGSTLVCQLLFNIAAQKFKFKNNLDEYFTITTLYDSEYNKVNGIIRLLHYSKSDFDRKLAVKETDDVLLTKKKEENKQTILDRIELLRDDPNYMIKLFSSDFTPDILKFVSETYDIVYLERKDKIKQFLSFLGLVQTNTAHYKENSPIAVDQIIYSSSWAEEFIKLDKAYQDFKNRQPGKVLYYEDFMAKGSNESALVELLDLSVVNVRSKNVITVPTPYPKDLEELVVNKTDWLEGRKILLDNLRLNSQRD